MAHGDRSPARTPAAPDAGVVTYLGVLGPTGGLAGFDEGDPQPLRAVPGPVTVWADVIRSRPLILTDRVANGSPER